MIDTNELDSKNEQQIICSYQDIDPQTRLMIEGCSFDLLPDRVTLDSRVDTLTLNIREAAANDLVHRSKYSLAVYINEVIRKQLESEDTDEERKRFLRKGGVEIKVREFGQRLYALNGQVVQSKTHRGENRKLERGKKRDAIDEQLMIVDAHSHPYLSPFSRVDLGIMLESEENSAQQCLYLLASGEIDMLAAVTKESLRLPTEQLIQELKLSGHGEEIELDLMALTHNIPDDIIQPRQMQFAEWFMDLLNHSRIYRVGIYVRKSEDLKREFKRVTEFEDIFNLMRNLTNF